MSPMLLDTQAAVWIAIGTPASPVVKVADDAVSRGELLLSPITPWEIGMLARKGRLRLKSTVDEYVRVLFGLPGVVTAILTPAIAVAAARLPASLHGDHADRIIDATAQAYGAQLITRDKGILAYAKISKKVLCLAC